MTSQTLGRIVEHDPRNRDYPFPVRRLTRAVSRTWACNAPILNQADVGSCEGNTAAEWLNCSVNLKNRKAYKGKNSSLFLREENAIDIYSTATRLDNKEIPGVYPPNDTGTSALGVAKAMAEAKAITDYQWTFGLEHFLAAIDQGPVMMGTNWYRTMFDPDKDGTVHIGGPVDGGHAWLARQIKYSGGRFKVKGRNHWRKDWGVGGEFWISDTDLERLLTEQGDVLVPARMT